MTNPKHPISTGRQMESVRLDNLLINFTTDFQRVWDTRSLRTSSATFWRPAPAPDDLPGFFPLGDMAVDGYANPSGSRIVAVVSDAPASSGDNGKRGALSRPEDFELVWNDRGSGAKAHVSIWRPMPPAGYVALGLVCSSDYEKPSLNAVRCVRTDLVVAAQVDNLIWSDKSSQAKKNFSAWGTNPPAATAGDICFAPGTFVGVDSHARPDTHVCAYALRMPISCQISVAPEPPKLKSRDAFPPGEPSQVTQIAKLPWFAVRDEGQLSMIRFRASPYYFLERADQYVLIGHADNNTEKGTVAKWPAPQLPKAENLARFALDTSIEMAREWPAGTQNYLHLLAQQTPVTLFSARLGNPFTHPQNASGQWAPSTTAQVVTIVGKKKSVAIYQLQSTYRLLRTDGTQVASSIEHSSVDNLYMTQYPAEDECTVHVTKIDDEAAPVPAVETLETTLPSATDTAP